MNTIYATLPTPLQQSRVDVFQEIFTVFLGLGTLVGIVVVSYTVYNAYKYREDDEASEPKDAPTLGELPTGGEGGKKLFLSFGLSAIIVVSLIVWTYGMLLYVEDGPQGPSEDAVEVDVTGSAFSWSFEYSDDASTTGELIVPEDREVWLNVTSSDVWHSFGLTDERAKADAIPGETDETWFIAEETGTNEDAIECFELCGDGHSGMTAHLTVVDEDLYDAAAEDDALDVLFDGLGNDDLDVDSSPSEFDEYQEEVAEEEEEEESNDEE